MLFDLILSLVLLAGWILSTRVSGSVLAGIVLAWVFTVCGMFISSHSWLITGIPSAIAWLLTPELGMSLISLAFLGMWYVCIMLTGDWAEVDAKRFARLRAVPEEAWKFASFVCSTGLLVWAGVTISHALL